MLDIKRMLASAPHKPEDVELQELFTPWGEALAAGDERQAVHPRPQLARENFELLDGWWDYAIKTADEAADAWRRADGPETWDGHIRVPYSPEAPLSGVNRQVQPNELLWYRRTFATPDLTDDRRVILHFEAVDHACACYVNGSCAGEHVGGYLPFSFDVTDLLEDTGNELVVCVYDPSDAGTQLRGKQRRARGGIWYTAQSGMWQSVWVETIPEEHIVALTIDPRPDEEKLAIAATVHGDATLAVRLLDNGATIACAEAPAEDGRCELALDVPEPHLWSPDDPHLYDLELSFGHDRTRSYCAFRTVSVEPDAQGVPRFHLNHKPLFLRGVLDQGYWPDGLMTAPVDEALAFDVRTMRELGFNLLRKHIKVESDRYYYWCDKLGMLVWQDMVSGGATPSPWHSSYKPTFFRRSWSRYADDDPHHFPGLAADDPMFHTEWIAACEGTVEHLRNHPCICAWVLFNEAWGQFEARRAVGLVRRLDPTRPIDAVSGWYDQRCGDFLSVHNYFRPLEVYADAARPHRAFVISEFGGLSLRVPGHSALPTSYGYGSFGNLTSFRAGVRSVLAQADALEAKGLAGYVYTQLSDVEEETNGLITYDRRVNKLEEGECL